MAVSRRHTLLMTLVVGLFLWVQSAAVVHAASYGDGPHDHDGVKCEMYRVAGSEQVILPAPVPVFPAPFITHEVYTPVINERIAFWPPERAPPPRGPPLVTQ